jgi:hypothetical protein
MEKPNTIEEPDGLEDYSFATLQLGIWRLLVPVESATGKVSLSSGLSWACSKWNELKSMLPIIWRFLWEVYSLDPRLNLWLFILRLGASVEGTLMLYASSQLLRTVSHPESLYSI